MPSFVTSSTSSSLSMTATSTSLSFGIDKETVTFIIIPDYCTSTASGVSESFTPIVIVSGTQSETVTYLTLFRSVEVSKQYILWLKNRTLTCFLAIVIFAAPASVSSTVKKSVSIPTAPGPVVSASEFVSVFVTPTSVVPASYSNSSIATPVIISWVIFKETTRAGSSKFSKFSSAFKSIIVESTDLDKMPAKKKGGGKKRSGRGFHPLHANRKAAVQSIDCLQASTYQDLTRGRRYSAWQRLWCNGNASSATFHPYTNY